MNLNFQGQEMIQLLTARYTVRLPYDDIGIFSHWQLNDYIGLQIPNTLKPHAKLKTSKQFPTKP